jgi:hypothetical protein
LPASSTLLPLNAGGERAEDITAAVQLSTLAADRKVELIGELLAAKNEDGQPIGFAAAVRRIQKEQAEKSKDGCSGRDADHGRRSRKRQVHGRGPRRVPAGHVRRQPAQADFRHGQRRSRSTGSRSAATAAWPARSGWPASASWWPACRPIA